MKKNNYIVLFAVLLFCFSSQAGAQIITTLAGTVASGYSGDGGPATAAQLFHPKGAASDDTGYIYIADADNNVIRRVSPLGVISTFAGMVAGGFFGDGGPAGAALLNRPNSVAFDHHGNMYICDADNQRVRKVDASGIITTIVGDGTAGAIGDGGPATAAEINYPGSIALDDTGNLYIADEYNNSIRKVDTFGVITTFAGNGSTGYTGEGGDANAAAIGFPFGLATDHAGNVYFSLTLDNRICKVNSAHIITTAAGIGGAGAFSGDGGPATAAEFDNPWGIATDAAGNLYIADNANERIRKVTMLTGTISTVAGNGSSGFFGDGSAATAAKIRDPAGVYVDGAGNIYIADYNNHRVRKVGTSLMHPPAFTGGDNQALAVCNNETAVSVDTLLAVIDSDAGQLEHWSVVLVPLHGTLVAAYSTISTGSVLMPAGLSYTPATGYSGSDSFKVRISDGTASDTTTVHVTINPCSLGIVQTEEGVAQLFPNPCSGNFTFNMVSISDEPVRVTITNMMGRVVRELMTTTNKPEHIQLNEPAGIYLLSAATAQGVWYRKLTIVR